MRLNHALGLWVYFKKKNQKKTSWAVGLGKFGKDVFKKNHAHLGELNSEKISVVAFCVFIIFCDFQNYTSNDQNAISAYFASRFY